MPFFGDDPITMIKPMNDERLNVVCGERETARQSDHRDRRANPPTRTAAR